MSPTRRDDTRLVSDERRRSSRFGQMTTAWRMGDSRRKGRDERDERCARLDCARPVDTRRRSRRRNATTFVDDTRRRVPSRLGTRRDESSRLVLHCCTGRHPRFSCPRRVRPGPAVFAGRVGPAPGAGAVSTGAGAVWAHPTRPRPVVCPSPTASYEVYPRDRSLARPKGGV